MNVLLRRPLGKIWSQRTVHEHTGFKRFTERTPIFRDCKINISVELDGACCMLHGRAHSVQSETFTVSSPDGTQPNIMCLCECVHMPCLCSLTLSTFATMATQSERSCRGCCLSWGEEPLLVTAHLLCLPLAAQWLAYFLTPHWPHFNLVLSNSWLACTSLLPVGQSIEFQTSLAQVQCVLQQQRVKQPHRERNCSVRF